MIEHIERLIKLVKSAGLRKMGIGFAMFQSLCVLVYSAKIPADVFSALTTALIAAMFMGNVAEHFTKKDQVKPEA